VVRLGQEELRERRVQLERLDLLAPVDQVKIQFDIITLKNFDLKKNGLPNFSWNAWSSRNAGSCWSSRGTWSTWNNGKINCWKFSFKLKIPTTYFSS
jgi:hypothetical protein